MDLRRFTFNGYVRSDGSVGVRNFVGIISTVTCANQAAMEIGRSIEGSAVFTHQQGCGQTIEDLQMAERTLLNLGLNPNLGAVLLVSLGCEGVNAENILQGIAAAGKPVEMIRIQSEGDYSKTLSTACSKARELLKLISSSKREEMGINKLRIGVKCGASDPTSGLAANPAIGNAVDRFIEAGAGAVFGETTELVGAEHILARRCVSDAVAEKLLNTVESLEQRVRQCAADIRGGNPSAGNIAAGLSTLEEKSLGAITKAGTKKIKDVFKYGERPPLDQAGLYFVDSPGREPELLAALASAGCQVIFFSTGIGAPQSFPFVPVIKVCGNPNTNARLAGFIDIDVSALILGKQQIEDAGKAIFLRAAQVCSGSETKAEINGYIGSTGLHQIGPII